MPVVIGDEKTLYEERLKYSDFFIIEKLKNDVYD